MVSARTGKDKPLGEHIVTELMPEGVGKSFAAKSGTLGKPREEFALKACEHINTWDDMTEHAKAVARRVYAFIKEHNA